MKIIFWSVLFMYLTGFMFIFWVNALSGPVTIGLSFVRAVVWPVWVVTGKPEGQRL